MFYEILKRDIKRKKTMNLIIFIFVIMSVTFVCSSVSNLSSTFSSIDDYFTEAGIGDFVALERYGEGKTAKEVAEALPYVKDIKVEEVLYNAEGIEIKTGESIVISDIVVIGSIERRINKYYTSDNTELTEIEKGGVYIRPSNLETLKSEVGDTIKISMDGISKEYKILGMLKDPVFGGSMMDAPKFVISEADFQDYLKGENIDLYKGFLDYFYTEELDKISKDLTECTNIAFMADKGTIKFTYMMEMIVALLLMIVSICLIIIALIILKFTISFTISEEYKEIGIMKAIGIPSTGIRVLYLVKYFTLSILGALIGFCVSFPFADMMMKKTRETIVVSQDGSVMLSIISALAVIAVVMFFSFRATRNIKKFTPVDAIRNGSTGERYKKKGILKLHKSGAQPVFFMAVNDILSGLKRFVIMLVVFCIGILLIMVILSTVSTLKSGKLVRWLGVTESEVYLSSTKNITDYHNDNGKELLRNDLNKIREIVSENGMPCIVKAEVIFKYSIKKGDLATNSTTFLGVNTDTNDYDNYLEGSAPQNTNEIAIHYALMEKIGAKIGDKVTLTDQDGSREYIISGTMETMTNMGEGIRLYQDDDRNYNYMNGIWGIQIDFTDDPSEKEVEKRIEKIKELLPDYKVMTPGGYTDKVIHAASYMDETKGIILIVVLFINILVVVLMEKSFLTKERGEIACLKAIGFKNSSIVIWQTLRVFIVLILSTILAIILNNPVCQISSGAVFRAAGAKKIIFDPNILESYIIYPLIIIATTLFGVILTALSVRNISANEINSIE